MAGDDDLTRFRKALVMGGSPVGGAGTFFLVSTGEAGQEGRTYLCTNKHVLETMRKWKAPWQAHFHRADYRIGRPEAELVEIPIPGPDGPWHLYPHEDIDLMVLDFSQTLARFRGRACISPIPLAAFATPDEWTAPPGARVQLLAYNVRPNRPPGYDTEVRDGPILDSVECLDRATGRPVPLTRGTRRFPAAVDNVEGNSGSPAVATIGGRLKLAGILSGYYTLSERQQAITPVVSYFVFPSYLRELLDQVGQPSPRP